MFSGSATIQPNTKSGTRNAEASAFQGASVSRHGVLYRTWAPLFEKVDVVLSNADGSLSRVMPMSSVGGGSFELMDSHGRAGDLYRFRLGGEKSFPDPASRWQPDGVHGASMVIDPKEYHWQDAAWIAPGLRDMVIYEMHVGTFTPAGTFLAAIEKLPHIRNLGANAVEIMPVAEFVGARNWGYDGVSLYAPSRAYGHPDHFRALVDAAHALGITVILDVVYNHFGPDGNYLPSYVGDYIDEREPTPWGGAIRYGNPEFRPLRDLITENPIYWMRDFHIDGFRLDATHAIKDHAERHILQEITAKIHHAGSFVIAEDSRRDLRLVMPERKGGMGFDGVWADDFHHSIRVACTGIREAYFAPFKGDLSELTDIVQHGWLPNKGEFAARAPNGTELTAPQCFIHCISNHDQTGNRALGERFSHCIPVEAYKTAAGLLCLGPGTPLIFMGDEWSASTPFLFFTDHEPELGRLVTAGRREEFREFSAFRDEKARSSIPDPQECATFLSSKLRWEELPNKRHAEIFSFYRECLALRMAHSVFRPTSRDQWSADALKAGAGALWLRNGKENWLVLFDLVGKHRGMLNSEPFLRPLSGFQWDTVLSTNEERFGGSGAPIFIPDSGRLEFEAPGLVVLRPK